VATSSGQLLALDPETLAVRWQDNLLPPQAYANISVRPDGSRAYLSGTGQNEVIEMDLLRRHGTGGTPFPHVSHVAVSNDGMALAVVDAPGAVLHLLDLETGAGMLVATGPNPIAALWPPADDGVLVSSAAAGGLIQIERATGAALSFATAAGAGSLTSFQAGADGPTVVVVGNFGASSLTRFTYQSASAPPAGLMTVPAPTAPTLVRTPGQ
jgi:sugar lactone lactonase YvrE